MTLPLPPLRLLHDNADLWSRATDVLGPLPAAAASRVPVGVVTWRHASREEVAELDSVRGQHDGPIVALVEQLPSARGARALSTQLEGSVLAEDMERSLR